MILPKLTYLDLSESSGLQPSDIASLSTNCSSLTALSLADCNGIEEGLTNLRLPGLTRLDVLAIDDESLADSIDSLFSNCSKLINLDVSGRASFDLSRLNLKDLEILDVSGSRISCPDLEVLSIDVRAVKLKDKALLFNRFTKLINLHLVNHSGFALYEMLTKLHLPELRKFDFITDSLSFTSEVIDILERNCPKLDVSAFRAAILEKGPLLRRNQTMSMRPGIL